MTLHYLALGDSVAAGYRATYGIGYVGLLHRYLLDTGRPWRLFNLARPGATTYDLPQQAVRAVALRPDLLTLNIGGNDLRRGLPNPRRVLAKSIASLERSLSFLRKHTSAPIFLAEVYNPVPRRSGLYDLAQDAVTAFNGELRQAARKFGCSVVPLMSRLADSESPVYAPDQLHPNNTGHRVIARSFLDAGLAGAAASLH